MVGYKDNPSWITVGVADAGKKINTVQLSLCISDRDKSRHVHCLWRG